MTNRIHEWKRLSAAEQDGLLRRPALRADDGVQQEVRSIIDRVRAEGDAAVADLTRLFDGVALDSFRVDDAELVQAERELPDTAVAAIEQAIANVRRFHEAEPPTDYVLETAPGIRCERLSHPIDAVGLYVPAGTAPLPSTAVMLAVPAFIAGCPRRVLCTPPRPDGRADAAVLLAARLGGVHDVYKIGGVQAIAAMAYGTESLPKVDRIFGPGNAWVTAAKSQVAADPRAASIDMLAGPSELLVIADRHADAAVVAADLLSQAEHGEDSQVLLVTTDERLAQNVLAAIEEQLTALTRKSIAGRAIDSSRFIVVENLDLAVEVANAYAPEHLSVQTAAPRDLLPKLRNAGSVFLGAWSPETAGDYASGTNHVLPTYGQARSVSGLGVDQFMRRMTVQELSEEGLRSISGALVELARLEGLDAHAAAVQRRLAATVPSESRS